MHEWFKTYYGPTNAVLVVAGDIERGRPATKVKKYFGDIPAGPPVRALQGLDRAAGPGQRRAVLQDRVLRAGV